jgi:hypothetical protein
MYNTGTMKVSLNHTLPISLYYSTHKVFKSHVKSSQADFNYECHVAIYYRKLNSVNLGTLLYSHGTDIQHRKDDMWLLLLCDITANHWKHMSCDPYTLLCDVTTHASYSKSPWVDMKKTLPQYCCVASKDSAPKSVHSNLFSSLFNVKIKIRSTSLDTSETFLHVAEKHD